jgi:dUTP pyrophosphatase
MSYHLYIKIHDASLVPIYEQSIRDFYDSHDNEHRDSGFDLFVANAFNGESFSRDEPLKIDHGVSCAMYKHTSVNEDVTIIEPTGYYMYPRSSISKTPYRLANSVGIIDSGYRGNLIAKIDKIYDIQHIVSFGNRLFQICTPDLSPLASVTIVDDIDNTSRGIGGFGSTGK